MPDAPSGNFAIYFHPDGYTVDNRPLVGRRAAGQSFLDAWLASTDPADMVVYADSPKAFETFRKIAAGHKDVSAARLVPRRRPAMLREAGAVYWPTPVYAVEAWRRAAVDPAGWSLFGVTHTTATAAIMDAFTGYASAPLRDFDAVICTSKAVKATLDRVLTAQEEFLKRRTGGARYERPQFPIIPLGVHADAFAPDAGKRAETRAALGIGDADICALFLGRLSYHAKAHHIPFFRAVEKAARATGLKFHVLLVGWFANETIEKRFREGARDYCPSATLHVLDGRDASKRAGAWSAGDLFCSLVDNIQETFGLTPVEAMAAGLPAIVSDWDGYKETVREGTDGFRIPTLMPMAGLGNDLADGFGAELLDYDHYMRDTALRVVVDVDAAAEAIARLARDPELRRSMGAAGRERAKAVFDWPVVLKDYRGLVVELAGRRKYAQDRQPKPHVWPARLSPFDAFGSYASRRLSPDLMVARTDPDAARLLDILLADSSAEADGARMAGPTRRILALVPEAPGLPVARIVAAAEGMQPPFVMLRLAWLAKWGLVRIA